VNRRLLPLLAFVVLAATAAAGCDGSSPADLGAYLGTWQRVEGGAPNQEFTLTIARRDDTTSATFANLAKGASETVAATAVDGYLACTLTTGDTWTPAAEGAPAEADLQLSLDENGQLVVDLVLADGTLEPIWVYDRGAASSPAEP
jgi:hypothetical protein